MSEVKNSPWKAVPLGGASTVVCSVKPGRNDTRIPAFGYDESKGYCVGYPFVEDDGRTRLDFVCFSHDHARLIAAAPELLAAAVKHLAAQEEEASANMALDNAEANFSDARPEIRRAGIAMVAASTAAKELRAAIAKALGEHS